MNAGAAHINDIILRLYLIEYRPLHDLETAIGLLSKADLVAREGTPYMRPTELCIRLPYKQLAPTLFRCHFYA
jgi:hypothetical protein